MSALTSPTPRQAEVLAVLTRAGQISYKAQTGRVKTVLRALAAKGLAAIDGDAVSPVAVTPPRHYSAQDVIAAAEPVEGGDGRWKRASLVLAEGDTIWNPYSTKKVYRGSGLYVFMIHPGSIDLTSRPTHAHVVHI